MILKRFEIFQPKDGRETIFLSPFGSSIGFFKEDVRQYANGLLNSHGGIMYFGIKRNGTIIGSTISRKEEDEYRLAIDHTFGSFQPFVTSNHYRLNFIPVAEGSGKPVYTVIELKVSVGPVGEIYEDGFMKVYLIDETRLVGPLYPQELKELILLKYKESLEGAEQAARFATPNLMMARAKAKLEQEQKKNARAPMAIITEVEESSGKISDEKTTSQSSRNIVNRESTAKQQERKGTGEEFRKESFNSKATSRTLINYRHDWF